MKQFRQARSKYLDLVVTSTTTIIPSTIWQRG
jgi:hypothetical protein